MLKIKWVVERQTPGITGSESRLQDMKRKLRTILDCAPIEQYDHLYIKDNFGIGSNIINCLNHTE